MTTTPIPEDRASRAVHVPSSPSPVFQRLSGPECAALLETHSIGRIGWQAADGQLIVPVTYVYRDGLVFFRTSPDGVLSELVRPTEVAMEVDEFDLSVRTGWSVLVRGQAAAIAAPSGIAHLWEDPELVPWAPGGRTLFIQIRAITLDGRIIRRA